MSASPDLWLFFVMVFGVIALPGMDMAFVGASTLASGVRGGVAALLGVMAGGAVHVIVAASGAAAFLAVWPAAFNGLLLCGTVYMVHVGWTLMRARPEAMAFDARLSAARGGWRIFGKGTLTCLANPKAYVFMLAIFPAFMGAGEGAPAQALRLGLVIALTQGLIYGLVVGVVGGARRAAGIGGRSQSGLARVAGLALMAGAVLTLGLAWRPA